MPSQKKAAANRANAAKSTGPKTAEGKARSSANALKGGLFAQTPTIRGEDSATYDRLTMELIDLYSPVGPIELTLVRQIANNIWRLRRLELVEVAYFEQINDAILGRSIGTKMGMERMFAFFWSNRSEICDAADSGDIKAMHQALRPIMDLNSEIRISIEDVLPPEDIAAKTGPDAAIGLAGYMQGVERRSYSIIGDACRRLNRDFERNCAALFAMQERRLTQAATPIQAQ